MDLRTLVQAPLMSGALNLLYAVRGAILTLHRIVPRHEFSSLEADRKLELAPEQLGGILGIEMLKLCFWQLTWREQLSL
jgi:hypothetical protein